MNFFKQFDYSRSGNPSRDVLERCLAALDGGKYGLCFASGLGATTALVGTLSAGDHILCCDDVYGGTNRLLNKVVSRLGIKISHVDCTDVATVEKSITTNTKVYNYITHNIII